MRASSSVTLPVHADAVSPWLVDLGRYPLWMPMVHAVTAEDGTGNAWSVELRARVGPFARSKRLRMVRTSDDVTEGGRRIVFERAENDGARHSSWVMTVDISPAGADCTVSIDLEYGGSLWTAGVLDKVLASNIDDGKKGLARVVSGPTR